MKIQLKKRQFEILKALIAAGTPLDIHCLTRRFHKSERTIRYDVNEVRDLLNKYDIEVRTKAKQGFYIPAEQKPKASRLLVENIQCEEASLLDDSDEMRYNTLFFYLLLQNKPVSADELADVFYISRSTMLRLLNGLDKVFDEVNVVSQKASGFLLEGEEYALRKRAAALLALLFKGSYTPEDWYLLLPRVLKDELTISTLASISQAIKRVNTRYNVWLSNTAFIGLLSYCTIRRLRLSHGFTEHGEALSFNQEDYVSSLLLELDDPSVNEKELYWLNLNLSENGIWVTRDDTDIQALEEALDAMIFLLKENRHQFPYVFDTISLYDDLHQHLQHTLRKEYLHLDCEENPLIDDLKENYEDFHLLAEELAEVFEQICQVALSANQKSYLAIYLYKNLINQRASNKKVLIVCATGKGLSNLLTTRIRNVFQNLTIVSSISPYQLQDINSWKGIDFVISTIPIPHSVYPVIKISRILSMEDIQRIQEFLHYGKFIDSIPMKYSNSASFNAKNDPFDLFKLTVDPKKTDFAAASTLYSKLQLTLLEYLSKLPVSMQMSQDAILGLLIHMSMAVPRWFSQPDEEDEEDLVEAYMQIRNEHGNVFNLMEKFFSLVEESLLITIPIQERYAFFLYIINKEG